MSISAIVSSPFEQLSNLHHAAQKPRTEFQQLTQALLSGGLAGAQPASPEVNAGRTNIASLGSAKLTQELKALGAALQSGDPAATGDGSAAASRISPDAARSAHHHYHRGGGSPALTSGFPNSSGSPRISADASELLQPLDLTV